MKRSQIHILIVDDDATQGKALLEAFNRQGYTATWCNSAAQALTTAQRQEFHCLFIDCVLPKMNGVDLAEELVNLAVNKPKLFLYSGIFKDRSFIREAIERTKCQAFLSKPLDLENILGSMDGLFGAVENNADDPPMMRLYSKKVLDDNEILAIIAEETTIHGLHLPVLLKALQKSRLSGDLSLISGVGDMSTVSFYDGRIFAVRTPDKETFFGALAVDFGFVAADDIVDAVRNPSTKRIGQKLIESFSLSPHAINVILEEQLALRLSQCVQNSVVSLQWANRKYEAPESALNITRFEALCDDWLHSKFDLETLRSAFGLWANFLLEGNFHFEVRKEMTLGNLAQHESFIEERDLPYLFRQLLRREAFFGTKAEEQQQDFSFLESRLDLFLKEYKAKNYFQILGLSETAKSSEINKSFTELDSYFNPQKLPENCPPDIVVKATKVFAQLEKAFNILSDDAARSQYVVSMDNERAQSRMAAEPVLRAAILELHHGHAAEAAEKFQSLMDKKLEIRDLRSYRIWSGIKADRKYRGITLDQIPPEERHTAPYMMACGVYYRSKGKVQKAVECFRKAHILDPRLSVAKSELKGLLSDLERNKMDKTMIRDVSNVMESLFGKTRRGA